MVSLKTALAVPFLLVLISGCSVLPERTAKKNFMLPEPSIASVDGEALPLTLRVQSPAAEPPLDSTNILVNPTSQSVKAYGGARWAKPAPELVQDHLIEGLRQSSGLKAVISATADAVSDYSLSSDLSMFQIRYPQGEPAVMIQLDAQILEQGSRRVIAAKRFKVQIPVADEPVESVISGFGQASQAMTEEVVAWLLMVLREP